MNWINKVKANNKPKIPQFSVMKLMVALMNWVLRKGQLLLEVNDKPGKDYVPEAESLLQKDF